jgi:hypothetical protein
VLPEVRRRSRRRRSPPRCPDPRDDRRPCGPSAGPALPAAPVPARRGPARSLCERRGRLCSSDLPACAARGRSGGLGAEGPPAELDVVLARIGDASADELVVIEAASRSRTRSRSCRRPPPGPARTGTRRCSRPTRSRLSCRRAHRPGRRCKPAPRSNRTRNPTRGCRTIPGSPCRCRRRRREDEAGRVPLPRPPASMRPGSTRAARSTRATRWGRRWGWGSGGPISRRRESCRTCRSNRRRRLAGGSRSTSRAGRPTSACTWSPSAWCSRMGRWGRPRRRSTNRWGPHPAPCP